MAMFTNSLYCAVCGAPFELPDICDHEDAVHENPADEDDSYSICHGLAYDSRKLSEGETKAGGTSNITWRLSTSDPNLENHSTSPHFYISGPALWERRDYGESNMPFVPDRDGQMLEIRVYDPSPDADGMLFPLHEACWGIVHRLCTVRRHLKQHRDATWSKPDTLERFCDAFVQCSRRNLHLHAPDLTTNYSGGLRWPRQGYGVTRYWSDGWDCERGGEVCRRSLQELVGFMTDLFWKIFCAAPVMPGDSPTPTTVGETPLAYHGHADRATIDHLGPDKAELDADSAFGRDAEGLPSPLSSNTTSSSSSPTDATENASCLGSSERSQMSHMDQCSNTSKAYDRWEKQIEKWIWQADSSQDPAWVLERATECFAHAPLGIQNRWRIFKILQAA
ncbi:MAG: hypothetical protein Q9210_005483 [Variospora velana]